MINVAVVNESTVVTDAEVQQCIEALKQQANTDFSTWWGTLPITVTFLAKGSAIPKGWWELVFADNSDQVGALGYHELTENGDPIGFVFCKDDLDFGTSWTITASHELLEMRLDSHINSTVEVDNSDGSMTFYMKEVCDACEDDQFGYDITISDGTSIKVSDFVTPEFFIPGGTGPFDFRSHITKPLEILTNGYLAELQVKDNAQWSQVTGELVGKAGERVMPTPYHRRHRRLVIGHKNWQKSAPRS